MILGDSKLLFENEAPPIDRIHGAASQAMEACQEQRNGRDGAYATKLEPIQSRCPSSGPIPWACEPVCISLSSNSQSDCQSHGAAEALIRFACDAESDGSAISSNPNLQAVFNSPRD